MADTRACSNCGASILKLAGYCPKCGARQDPSLNEDELSRDPFDILQVSRTAEGEVIEAAYRSLARKYHPDAGGGHQDAGKMRDINWAYGVLKDPGRRQEWVQGEKRASEESPEYRQGDGNRTPSGQSPNSTRPNETREPDVQSANGEPGGPTVPGEVRVRRGNPLVVVGVIAAIILVLAMITNGAPRTSAFPANTPTRASGQWTPTVPRAKSPTPRAQSSFNMPTAKPTCLRWDRVTDANIGPSRCAYGEVVKFYSTEQYAQIVRFSDEAGTFLLRGRDYYFEGLKRGDCVAATGDIARDGNYLYMEISGTDLYRYSSCN